MNATQENKVSMFYKVKTFTDAHSAGFSSPQIDTTVTNFDTALVELGEYEQEASEVITGYAAQKNQRRIDLRDLALGASGALVAFYIVTNNKPNQDKYRMTKSMLDALRDTEFLYKCQRLGEALTDAGATLAQYGYSAGQLSDYNTALNNYKLAVENPGDQRSEGKAYGIAVDDKIREIDVILELLDALMAAQNLVYPILYQQYLADRLIDDNATGGGTPPDITVTIAANSFQNVLTVSYLASRSFKAKNLSNSDALSWGLSQSPTEFSGLSFILNPDSISTRLSSTLAPSGVGDILLFNNTTANPVDIEVTVLE